MSHSGRRPERHPLNHPQYTTGATAMSTLRQVAPITTVTASRNKPPRRDTTTLSNPTPEKTQQGYQNPTNPQVLKSTHQKPEPNTGIEPVPHPYQGSVVPFKLVRQDNNNTPAQQVSTRQQTMTLKTLK